MLLLWTVTLFFNKVLLQLGDLEVKLLRWILRFYERSICWRLDFDLYGNGICFDGVKERSGLEIFRCKPRLMRSAFESFVLREWRRFMGVEFEMWNEEGFWVIWIRKHKPNIFNCLCGSKWRCWQTNFEPFWQCQIRGLCFIIQYFWDRLIFSGFIFLVNLFKMFMIIWSISHCTRSLALSPVHILAGSPSSQETNRYAGSKTKSTIFILLKF